MNRVADESSGEKLSGGTKIESRSFPRRRVSFRARDPNRGGHDMATRKKKKAAKKTGKAKAAKKSVKAAKKKSATGKARKSARKAPVKKTAKKKSARKAAPAKNAASATSRLPWRWAESLFCFI